MTDKKNNISPAGRFRRCERILKQEAAGTIVLLSLDDGQYYSLDNVGARAWDFFDGTQTVSAIAAALSDEFEAPAETIEADLIELITDLSNENLVVENTQAHECP